MCHFIIRFRNLILAQKSRNGTKSLHLVCEHFATDCPLGGRPVFTYCTLPAVLLELGTLPFSAILSHNGSVRQGGRPNRRWTQLSDLVYSTNTLTIALLGRYTLPVFTGRVHGPWTRAVNTAREHGCYSGHPCELVPVTTYSEYRLFKLHEGINKLIDDFLVVCEFFVWFTLH